MILACTDASYGSTSIMINVFHFHLVEEVVCEIEYTRRSLSANNAGIVAECVYASRGKLRLFMEP